MFSPVPGGGDISLGGMKRTASVPAPKPKPWYINGQWWKQASVWISILLSAVSLILGSVGEFQVLATETQRGLNVSGLVVNAISVILSALTSLDWRSVEQAEADLLKKLDSLLVQQPVMAAAPDASRPATPTNTTKPTTKTVHVLKLHRPDEEGEEEVPLVTSSTSTKKKRAKRRRASGRGSGGSGNSVGNGTTAGNNGNGDEEKRNSGEGTANDMV